MTEQMLRAIDERGHEHPVDILMGKNGTNHKRIAIFDITQSQKNIIRNHFNSDSNAPEEAIGDMTLLAVQGIATRDAQERATLTGLEIAPGSTEFLNSRYPELAGRSELLAEYVVWFDDIARSALARTLTKSDPFENAVQKKGFGLELGSVILAGEWELDKGLWKSVDDISNQLNERTSYVSVKPRDEVHEPRYKLSPIDSRGCNWRVVRERGLWDIETPSGERMWVAHRVVGMLAFELVGKDIQESLRKTLWTGASPSGRLTQKVGGIFEEEIATRGDNFGGIIPESTTVYLRHPGKK